LSPSIEALAARTRARVLWRPVLLGAIYRATNAPQGAAGSASDVFNPTTKHVTGLAFQRTIKRLGIPHSQPPQHPVKTTAPLRLLYYASEAQRPELSKALFRAYWVEGKNVSSTSTLIDSIKRSNVPGADNLIKAVESRSFEGEAERKQLEESTDLAVQRGTPGVPGFWVPHEQWTDREGKQRTGRLYWGQDRMQFLEAVLLANGDGRDLNSISTPLRSLEPRCERKGIPYMEECKLEFWYDFSSPWAFLGWTQLARLQRQFGDRLQIEMKPFLLGILFRE
jgi:2-hydroxychromene-2-carboxylate isomerase